MTTNKKTKDEIYRLKQKHRIENVMLEAGETFEADPKNSDLWRSVSTPGLVVDIRRQSWEIELPGMDKVTGDLIEWIKRRYSWSFGQALKFLEKRPADPREKQKPPQTAKVEDPARVQTINDEVRPLDDLQQEALALAGERIRPFFGWSFWKLSLYLPYVQITPVWIPKITHCDQCEKLLDWTGKAGAAQMRIDSQHGYKLQYMGEIPIVAYAIKHKIKLEDISRLKGDDKITEAINCLVDEIENVYVEDEDGIVCPACAWREYNFQAALSLVERSARKREFEAEQGSAAQRDTASWGGHEIFYPLEEPE